MSIEDIDEASDVAIEALLDEARLQQHTMSQADLDALDDDDDDSEAARERRAADPECEASTGKLSIDDFDLLAHLADGAYSTVEIGRRRATQRLYAVKCIDKGAFSFFLFIY